MKRIKKYSRELLKNKISKCHSDYEKLQLAENYGEEIRKRISQLESLMGLDGKGYVDINGKYFPISEIKRSQSYIYNENREIIKVIVSFNLGLGDKQMDEFYIRNDRYLDEYEELQPPLYLSNGLSYFYKEQLAKRGAKMTGGTLTLKKKKLYIGILSIQKELETDFGRGHKSSLTNAIKVYNQRNKGHWSDNDIHSLQVSIKYHQNKGHLQK